MDRLAEQVVAWHNRHPLAKRITIYDVHTIGVVALPFMRNAQADAAARHASGKVEPVLTDEISPESLAAAWDEEGLTIAAHPNAAHLDALADQEPPPRHAEPGWAERLGRLAFWRKTSGAKAWPVFSERFVSHLSPRRIAAFAQAHGYTQQPGDETWPQRIIPIDETLMDSGAAGGGAWPFELYLMSAAIDAGRSRSRILLGRGRPPAIVGRRCLSPGRLGLVALLLLALLSAAVGLTLPAVKKSASAGMAGPAASAPASAAASAFAAGHGTPMPGASGPMAAPNASASLPLAAATQASAASTAAPAPASAASSSQVSAEPEQAEQAKEKPVLRPDIRPMFIKPIPGRSAPPLGAPPQDDAPSSAPSSAPAVDKQDEKHSGKKTPETAPDPANAKAKSTPAHANKPKLSSEEPGNPGAGSPAPSVGPSATPLNSKAIAKASVLANKPVVALVGPVSANKADAEATLARMRNLLGPGQAGAALQAQVFQTPEGWRPAVWPFASREEAQLINATLIARGMRTRAVDF